jgi:hypothetical protein
MGTKIHIEQNLFLWSQGTPDLQKAKLKYQLYITATDAPRQIYKQTLSFEK